MSEFKNLPSGWKVVRLGEICNVKQGLQIPISERFCENAQNRYFYITNEFLKEKSEVKYYIENPPESTICFCDDILMTRTGNTGMVVTNVFGVFHNNFFKIAYDRQLIKKEYFVFCLTGSKIQSEILKRAGSSTIPDLNHSDFLSIKIPLPPLDEQEKIAEILSTWDEAINLTINLIESKKQFKKALMQNLLTAKIRFPQFKEKWKEIKLGEICEIQTGKLNANAMIQGGRYKFFTCAKEVFEIDDYVFDTEAILVSGNGENVGYIHYFNGKFNAYQRTYVLDKFTENILFIKYFLEFALKRKIEIEKKDGNTPYIVLSTIFGFIVKLPNLKEQQKIAEVLTACDDEINLLNLKLENLKKQKQGLMQKLLKGEMRTCYVKKAM
ncbi:restriction endonuclease subunit S [Campylobacter concisus]|jgi:type I R-M system specificity subunit|uniref:restriction endonuclease subunit S n=1 Tax=Campylobacter concisus TaxID=199 RepID=UPI000D31F5A0|nr:restriction endonuclease subunit S [Campylobacter concisus]